MQRAKRRIYATLTITIVKVRNFVTNWVGTIPLVSTRWGSCYVSLKDFQEKSDYISMRLQKNKASVPGYRETARWPLIVGRQRGLTLPTVFLL